MLLFGRLGQRTLLKFMLHNNQPINHHLTNQIIIFWCCFCHCCHPWVNFILSETTADEGETNNLCAVEKAIISNLGTFK